MVNLHDTTRLPLFPLGTVMFPGATLTLHIFEERYRLMIGQCLERSTPLWDRADP